MSIFVGLSMSAIGYYIYSNKESIGFSLLKTYTYVDEIFKQYTSNPNLQILDEITVVNDNDEIINKILVYKYQEKIYREVLEINQKSRYLENPELLDDFISPILACTVNIRNNNEVLFKEYDLTEYFNSFILPDTKLNLNEDNKIWHHLVGQKLSLSEDIIDNMNIKWSLVDDSATFHSNNNIYITLKDRVLNIIS